MATVCLETVINYFILLMLVLKEDISLSNRFKTLSEFNSPVFAEEQIVSGTAASLCSAM